METGKLSQSKEIKKEILITYAKCIIVFFLLLVLSMIIAKLYLGIGEVKSIFERFFMDDGTGSSLEDKKSILDYWFHNSIVNLIYILIGFIPFLYLPAIGLGLNSVLQGVLCAFLSIASNKGLLVCFIYGYGAHGIIENIANVLGFTLGILICRNATTCIKGKSHIRSIHGKLKYYIIIYCCVIIPILLVAAVVEAKVTPILMDQFKASLG